MEESEHNQNVYALISDSDLPIHISQVNYADRGLGNGYFCLGCKRQMQAILRKEEKNKPYFRHHVIIKNDKDKCTYSDETYRHKLAKDILQVYKKIKVPNLYKYSPIKNENKRYLIKESEYIEAHSVLIENYLYEDEHGNIIYSHRIEENNIKGLFIKPDVMFLNKNGEPILIIEIVATHKPDKIKLQKIKRLGINAIQVSIPKDSPENIENTFDVTNRTKWLYNYDEENTDYLQFSNSYSEGISDVDELQRKLFEEDFSCRSNQIRELIRGIERILETESYKESERDFRSEIQRIEKNTERERSELDELRRKYSEAGVGRYFERREAITKRTNEFQEYSSDLENRYKTKRGDLEQDEESTQGNINSIITRRSGVFNSIDGEREIIRKIKDDISKAEESEGRAIESFNSRRERNRIARESVGTKIYNRDKSIEEIPKHSELILKGKRERIENDLRRIEQEDNRISAEFEASRGEIETNYSGTRDELLTRFKDGTVEGSPEFTKEYSKLPELTKTLLAYQSAYEIYARIESYKLARIK